MDWLTIFATVIGAVTVFCLEDLAKRFWIDPLEKYRQLKSEVSIALTYNAQYLMNPIDLYQTSESISERYKKASEEIRRLGARMHACGELRYGIQPGMPAPYAIAESAKALIGLSNSFFATEDVQSFIIQQNTINVEIIRENLEIDSLEK